MLTPGSIVRCRNRDWVLLPGDGEQVVLLRPLTGLADDVVGMHSALTILIGSDLAEERVRSSTFQLPESGDVSDAASSHLLWQAARLTLREGATPFRSLGRISIRPRIYQFVPLLMALRLDPVRLFIADDVGVGKTIEALLIAREMYDRGEIRSICVLCPPYLCEQWQKEISEKLNLEAVVIRSGSVSQLERSKASADSIYSYYPIHVASIDFVKTDRNRHQFLQSCADFVIVDEAHGAADSTDRNASQQQRHRLVRDIAALADRHLVLLTATPHSGIEAAFRSLIGLLKPEFAGLDVGSMDEQQRVELARHFVQRTRRDITHDWDGEHCFPTREPIDETYKLSKSYLDLFNRTYDFCSEIVLGGQSLDQHKQRVRYWGALALLRCVMSSPAAALAALEARHDKLADSDDEMEFSGYVFESVETQTDDELPTPPIESAADTLGESDRRRLRALGVLAKNLLGTADDTKLTRCAVLVADLLKQGFNPIVWCRYIATAEYLGDALRKALAKGHSNVQVVTITGRMGDDERQTKIKEIDPEHPRVLVSTDCLSEGVNLQHKFSAALHYDLPWNPNRLEQREGRVDRYNQPSKIVKTIRYFSPDSPVDGVVLDVLLNKAREIHRALGTYVPVPDDSNTVTEAVLSALFLRGRRHDPSQLKLDLDQPDEQQVESLHKRWDRDVERERLNRTRFAQRALKPAEVRAELEASDAVLGDPHAVRDFVLNAAQRLNLHITPEKRDDVFRIAVTPNALATVPDAVTFALPNTKSCHWLVTFTSPIPEGAEDAEYLGRNHRFVAALARYLLEDALTEHGQAVASRCGVIRTRAVSQLTTIMLLRVRYLLQQPQSAKQSKGVQLLSEEVLVAGYCGIPHGTPAWIDDAEALRLLVEAKPDANPPRAEKQELIQSVLDSWPELEPALQPRILERAKELEASHKRVRQAVSTGVRGLTVQPQLPPDLLGILILQPVVGR